MPRNGKSFGSSGSKETKELEYQRNGRRDRITTLLKQADDITSKENPTKEEIEALSKVTNNVSNKLEIIKKLDDEISSHIKNNEKLQEEFQAADEYEDLITSKLKLYRQFIREHTDEPTSSNVSSTSSPAPSSAPVFRHKGNHLLKLTLEKFDGEIMKWPSFIDNFMSLIHEDASLNDTEQLRYLRANLVGPPAGVVDGLRSNKKSYGDAIELLRDKYGRQEEIRRAYVKAFYKLENPAYTVESLTAFHNKLETYVRHLEQLEVQQDRFEWVILIIVLEKLPPNLLTLFQRPLEDELFHTFKQFREALKREIRIMSSNNRAAELEESIQSSMPSTAAFYSSTATNSAARRPTQRKEKSCAFCRGPHYPNDCTVVTDSSKRHDIVKQNRLCFNCLGKHRVSDSKSKGKCRKCDRKHHTHSVNWTRDPLLQLRKLHAILPLLNIMLMLHLNPEPRTLLTVTLNPPRPLLKYISLPRIKKKPPF
ncbi:uncharacterized protein [Ptychodera flava]|uniref:uncharacterized protein n=1 Tax=Ptychodera flava TaxID=63121 RepID=UPI003969BB78